jgi:hypothetical protein
VNSKEAFRRRLVMQVIADLEEPLISAEARSEDERHGYIMGQMDAAKLLRETLLPELPGSGHDKVIEKAAIALGLEVGGRGSGWLESIWVRAFAEGQQQPSTYLLNRFLRDAGLL